MSLRTRSVVAVVRITTMNDAVCAARTNAAQRLIKARAGTVRLAFARLAFATMIACVTGLASAGCREDVPQAHLIGQGPFCIFGFCLYDAQLWAEHPPQAFDAPFALLLTYRRTIKAQRLVDAGMSEIERLTQSPLPAATLIGWRTEMARAFKDVGPGDELCGVFLPGRGARFYANGLLTTEVDDPSFALAFFRIWLDPDTRAARLRKNLLGVSE
jgi:hypothetical protein